jgi:hypothetical protein
MKNDIQTTYDYILNYLGAVRVSPHCDDHRYKTTLVLVYDVSIEYSMTSRGTSIRVDVFITNLTPEGLVLQRTIDLYFCNVTEFDNLFVKLHGCYILV